ncbi:glycerophosphodiester phosphodiesterase [Romboutsia lituseburensis]|uniref:Glycerophosphoryl diester phosphodiesterase n=1 Tax=Romboutsia lituseburensis DSM 797 TaxID=1121325 RepID=A0A1G9I3K9_9FIRM|nr:glycerophosphodiester phosphodiesterase [Romboutsia lituseburensis]CEH34056.1 Glycerophosphodiester phosphodiesterase protein [Romboutsia lituseburensis]SDL19820.1 glycerophosphoryl diester phosphodiesterase [Romboutsia lituseburensis DSM 797]
MKIFAHRGASGDYPENTMLSFKKAIDLGIKSIELDVHKSKDNNLVVIHDEDIERTFKGRGLVKDYTYDELKSFKCRKFEFVNNDLCKIPELEEVLSLIKQNNIYLNIEAKTDLIHYDLERDVLDLIEKYNLEDNVLISSFNHKCINIFKNLNSNIKYGALYHTKDDFKGFINVVEHAKNLGVYSINLNHQLVDKYIVDLAHKSNLKVFVYTVNDPILMRSMIECKVDGVFSDYPDLMREILNI